MTLIVGIKCEKGIVLGADGAATYGVLGTPTIRQPVKKKLRCMGTQVVVGVSGSVGLGQRIAGEVEAIQKFGIPGDEKNRKQLHQCKPHEVMGFLRHALWNIVGKELEIARVTAQTLGAAALNSALMQAVVVLLVGNEPCLFHFDQQGSAEQATDDLPFVAIGSGQLIADPFLAFIRRLFWQEQIPTIEQGVFAAVWSIQHTIKTNAGGVGPPIQIVIFRKVGQGKDEAWRAQEMPKEFNEERLQSIEALEGDIAKLMTTQTNTKNVQPPP
jgi:20S proteasome alpha/beta subunit